MTLVHTDDFSPSQMGEHSTRMSAAITCSKMAGHSSRAQPCSVMSGQTPVAISRSTARTRSTCTPCLRMMSIEIWARPSVLESSGDRFSVQLMNRARRSEKATARNRRWEDLAMARPGFTDMIGQVLKSAGQRRLRGVDAAFSISDLRRMAEKRLPKGPFGYMDGAAEDEVALRRNSDG